MKIVTVIIAILMVVLGLTSSTRAQDVIIAEFSTKFAWRGKGYVNRAHNVTLAASKLDGIIVAPGETFSYNETIGPRTEKRGFREAHVIISGETVDGIGGGICQVSSTLHAAVLMAGLPITEEHAHSRASLYISPTLDATVSWGSLDFRFTNNFPFPIKLQALIQQDVETPKKVLTVRILGNQESPYEVMLEFFIHKKRPHKTRWYLNSHMAPGTRKKREPGTLGYDMTRVRTIWDRQGNQVAREEVKYHYEPSDRIWDVGPKRVE